MQQLYIEKNIIKLLQIKIKIERKRKATETANMSELNTYKHLNF